MKDPQGFFYHQRKEMLQNWAISSWARKNGLSVSKIENHPRIAEVALLLEFDEHSTWFSQKDTEIWTYCWKWCYERELELTPFQKKKLLSIITGIEYRQQLLQKTKQEYQARVLKRQKIAERLKKKQNKLAAV